MLRVPMSNRCSLSRVHNYQYLAVSSGAEAGLTAPVEGDMYQTVNEYTVKVYYRPRGERADRLVGITTVSSGL